MLRRAVLTIARRQEALLQDWATGGQPCAAWRALQQSRAVHPSAAALLADKQPPADSAASSSSSSGEAAAGAGDATPPQAPGTSQSVFFEAMAKMGAAQRKASSGGVPSVTKFLGYSGALPFWVFSPPVMQHLPLDMLVDPSLLATPGLLQIGYGATILSFLGGVHWGLAMTNVGGDLGFRMADQRYLWSVLPCLMAWPTVAMPVAHAAGMQALLLGVVYAVDRAWAKKGMLPPWYISMRLPLTLLAASGLVMTAIS